MQKRIFISYSSKDGKAALTICNAIQARGQMCWISSRDVRPGENFQEAIAHAIRDAELMVLVFSENANNSSEIKKELALAGQNKLVVIPVRIEDVLPSAALSYEFATRQWIDVFDDWEQAIEQLGQQIDLAVAHAPGAPAAPPSSNPPWVAAPKNNSLSVGKSSIRYVSLLIAGGLVALLLAGGSIWVGRIVQARGKLNAKVQQTLAAARSAEKKARDAARDAIPAQIAAQQAQRHAQEAARNAERHRAGYLVISRQNDDGKWRWEGQVVNGTRSGFGILNIDDISSKETFEGDFHQDDDGDKARYGVFVDFKGHKYEGRSRRFSSGGVGVVTLSSGGRYEGNIGVTPDAGYASTEGFGVYKAGQANGIQEEAGNIYDADRVHGLGVIRWKNGQVWIGKFSFNVLDGYGAKYDAGGKIYEQGFYKDGVLGMPPSSN